MKNIFRLQVKGLRPLLILFSYSAAALAQSITIPIETKDNALVIQANSDKDLNVIYFGKKLAETDEYDKVSDLYKQRNDNSGVFRSVYTSSGSRNLLEPAITVTHADGDNSLDLKYVGHAVEKISDNVSLLSVVLKDPVYKFEVTLFYKTYFKENVVEQWSEIKHQEKGNVVLHKFASANLYLKSESYWLTHYHGNWAREMQPEEAKLTYGIKTLDSKLGTRANLYMPSVFMVSLNKPATENEGDVLFGALEYSGNFKVDLELDAQNGLRLIAGINNYASEYTLKPNKTFTTPKFLYTFSSKGKGEASRNMQRWARDYKLLDGNGERLTLLNNWESTFFDFNENKLFGLLKDTKNLGVDLFLLDDGWFANKYPRNGDNAGLGDWEPNKKKLPNGVASLVKQAGAEGVKFGIWIEPEMVNPKSELCENHPDWVIKEPARAEKYFRNQLVLDLSNPKVQDFVFGVVDHLFSENPKLAFIKWDCNAVIYNAHSAYLKNQSHFYIDYMRGLYNVLAKVRAKYPKVPMMLCSGGGGRVDYAALQYFTEFWPSDNTDPMERIFIQWEYSYFYPAITSANHVTDWGKQPIKFRTDVAMMGKLGFDLNVKTLSPTDLQFCKAAVQAYNGIKDVVWHGDQFRLANPTEGDVASLLYLTEDKSTGVIFNYLVNNRYAAGSQFPIKLQGLKANKKYKLSEINLYPGTKSTVDEEKTYTGEFLMNVGFNPDVRAGRNSVILKLEAM
ncbi:alpha-galactosidase [Pedobacter sp. UYP30]|uniref:alpha-galactosidase n=1 Tax=Pedobacter sp. UYP30 TaxID=1756400 RepID=UPI00339A9A7A